MPTRTGPVVLAAWMLSCVSACQAPAPSGTERLVAGQQPTIPDVPQPVGFENIEQVSEYALSASRRLYVRQVFRGRANPHALRNFYAETMPHHRWRKTSEVSVKGVHTMRFEKGAESCTITISRAAAARSNQLNVQVLILQEDYRTSDIQPRQTP